MDAVKQIYLLLICHSFYLGSQSQRWTFPSRISALIGSCVEIPCAYDPSGTSGASSTVWYLYDLLHFPEILNTKDPSSVMKEYKDRTSLVPGKDSCTLRIDPMRREDNGKYYYPGIAENKDINAYDRLGRTVRLNVTDKVNIQLHVSEVMTEGETTVIQCAVEHTCGSSPPSLQWNKPGQVQDECVMRPGGSWSEESELTYVPLYEDDGTPVQCTVTYPNEQRTETSRTLNIIYAPKNVTVTIIGMDEVIEGSNVTLQCNSYSKPDVDEYEWYKGKTKLPDRGREITVRNVTRDMEPYSCAARNHVGRGESALTEIPVLYKGSNHIILLATIGTICLLLLVLLVYACWRKTKKKRTSEMSAVQPESTYTDLRRTDITSIYSQLKPMTPAETTAVRSDTAADNEYENIHMNT